MPCAEELSDLWYAQWNARCMISAVTDLIFTAVAIEFDVFIVYQ